MSRQSLHHCLARAEHAAFPRGVTWITREGKPGASGVDVLVDFGIQRMRRGETVRFRAEKEEVRVLMSGAATIALDGGERAELTRASLFDEAPSAIHAATGATVEITAHKETEWAVIRTINARKQRSRFYSPEQCGTEDRGAGLVQGACRRNVRTIFDYASRPDSNLVVGEVVNYPGRWSSYPPHHHAQPEVYHYRFTLPQGYGHAELGEEVFRVAHGDTIRIPGGLDHAQVSAPGYGMYYLWVVRHLPRRPYKGFTFTKAHTWLLDPVQQGWQPTARSTK